MGNEDISTILKKTRKKKFDFEESLEDDIFARSYKKIKQSSESEMRGKTSIILSSSEKDKDLFEHPFMSEIRRVTQILLCSILRKKAGFDSLIFFLYKKTEVRDLWLWRLRWEFIMLKVLMEESFSQVLLWNKIPLFIEKLLLTSTKATGKFSDRMTILVNKEQVVCNPLQKLIKSSDSAIAHSLS